MPLTKREKKKLYMEKLKELLQEYNKILLVSIDNVGANTIQKIRQKLRGDAVLLFGKNTVIRKSFREYIEKMNEAGNKEGARIEALIPQVRGNVGLILSNGDLSDIKETVESFKQEAPAKVGSIAPDDVWVEAGPTGMEPTQTSFLQSLNINSKIVKGQVEITARVHLIKKGVKVGNSEAALLDKLGIKPFSYQANIKTVYDAGFVYPAELLNLGPKDVLSQLAKGVQRVATVGLKVGVPNLATIPHYIAKVYKNVLSVSVGTEYEFEGSKEIKAFLKDPSAFVVAAPVAEENKGEEKKEEEVKKEEPEEESASIGGLFGSDEESDF